MLAAPRPISSWSGSMRWRRLAASVWATETDSTKPMTEISSAGTASAGHSRESNDRQRQRRQALRDLADDARRPAAEVEAPDRQRWSTTTAATGPALAARSADAGRQAQAHERRLQPAAHPEQEGERQRRRSASVGRLVSPMLSTSEASDLRQRVARRRDRRGCDLSWLVAMRMPEAVMKPEITGCDRKLARKPSRNTPISDQDHAGQERQDERRGERSRPCPAPPSAPIAAAVISETTATGPTASARLVPKIA